MSQAIFYGQLEAGARYLAARAGSMDERLEHLGWANRYRRLGAEEDSSASPCELQAS
jgi:hypothetical protein